MKVTRSPQGRRDFTFNAGQTSLWEDCRAGASLAPDCSCDLAAALSDTGQLHEPLAEEITSKS